MIAIALGLEGAWGVPAAAFIGGLGAVALVYRLSSVAGRRLDPQVLVLAGVVVSAFTGALISASDVTVDALGITREDLDDDEFGPGFE